MRASRSFGTALATARSLQPCEINSFSSADLNTRGQNSGVPGRLLRTRCRVEFSPIPPNWSSVSTASTYETLLADDSSSVKQPFVQKPDAASVQAGRRLPYQLRDLSFLHGKEKPLQYGEVQSLVLVRKSQVSL